MRRVHCAFSNMALRAARARNFCGTRRPCAGLLDMPNVRRFLWRCFRWQFAAQFRKRWLFTDARRLMHGKIFRKVNFWWLCMNILRRRFFCAGFLCLPHKRASSLFLHCWRGGTLRLLHVRACAHIFCAQARRFLGWRCIGYRRTIWQRLPYRRFCSIFCSLLNESTLSKFLRCWGWRMLRRFQFRAQSYIICAETGRFRCLSRCVF